MQNLHHILIFISLITLIGLNTTAAFAATDNDTIHTREYIENISITEPQRALQVIDETEGLGLMPQYRLDHLRSMIYQNGLNMYRYALTFSLKAYRNDSIRRHPDEALLTLELITDQYNNTGNYTESIRYAIEGIELARQTGDKASEANLLLYIAVNKRHMGLKQEAEPYIRQSVELLEKVAEGSRDWREVDDLIYLYGTIGTFALDDGEYRKAIDLLPRYHKLMEQFKACTDLPDGIYDMRLTSIYALYTSVFAADGQMDKAEEYYRKFDATEYAHTDDGNQMRFDYLLAAGRYREALQFIHADKENYRAQGDTVNHYYVGRTLTFEAEAYMGLGDYKAAARTYKQMYDLADSLHVREKQNGVLEFAAIYETKEKEAELVEQTARLHESRMIALFTGCLVVLLGVLLWRTVRHVRIIRQKNVVMVRTVREQLAYKDELFRREEEVRTLQGELRQKTEELNRLEKARQKATQGTRQGATQEAITEKKALQREMQGQPPQAKMQVAEALTGVSDVQSESMQPERMQAERVRPEKAESEKLQPEVQEAEVLSKVLPEMQSEQTQPEVQEEAKEEVTVETSEEVLVEASTEVEAGAEKEIVTAGDSSAEEYSEVTMRGMFDRAKYVIMSRELYLRPDFSREELMELAHIPWNKFAGLFKKYTGMSFSKYTNKLRLEYATRLMEQHPEYSIEAVAEKCGISSSTTFYRLFLAEYRMTPKNFRDSLKQAEQEDNTDVPTNFSE